MFGNTASVLQGRHIQKWPINSILVMTGLVDVYNLQKLKSEPPDGELVKILNCSPAHVSSRSRWERGWGKSYSHIKMPMLQSGIM